MDILANQPTAPTSADSSASVATTPAPIAAAFVTATSPSSSGLTVADAGSTDKSQPLTGTIKQFFIPKSPEPANIEVTYRVEHTHDIVTVFTDQSTGKEVAQFPKDIIDELASFFDTSSGIRLDHTA